MIMLILFWGMFERFFVIQLGAPGSIIYIIDAINIYLCMQLVYNMQINRFWVLLVAYAILIGSSVVVALANYTFWGGNFIYTAIEIRNIVRFLIFFLACVKFLDKKNILMIFRVLVLFFYVNSAYIIYQFFTFHPEGTWMRGDLLNGFFGTETGGNTFVNALMLVVIVYLLCMWAEGQMKFMGLLIPLIISIAVAGMIELKAYFVEVVILYIWYLIRKKKSYKEILLNVVLIATLVIVAYVALQYMYMEYPWFRETMSLKGMISSLTDSGGYTGEDDLNRLTGIFTISDKIFKGELAEILFGVGLGNAVTYSLGGAETHFSQLYAKNHYAWFSNTYVFVQCGALGVIINLFTFIYILIKKKANAQLRLVTEMMALMAVVLFFYGEALKTDAGYFVYFALACGFVSSKEKRCFLKSGDM